MSKDFRSYLATEIISEQRIISYRDVSRALKVHVNAAKCMLYEFYEFENKKRPESVHATYLIAGTRRTSATRAQNGSKTNAYDDDQPMPSSPPPFTSSMLEPSEHESEVEHSESLKVSVKSITLVREEILEGSYKILVI